MKIVSPNQTISYISRVLYVALYMLVSAMFFTALYRFMVTARFLAIAAMYAPTLALLFGFASVLYGRARAYSPGPEQRRCLYAAERSLQASLLFMIAGALGAAVASSLWLWAEQSPTVLTDEVTVTLWFFVPIMFALMSFGAFFFALRAIGHRLLRWLHTEQLARRIRRAL